MTRGARIWRIVHLSDVRVVGERYGFRIESGQSGPIDNRSLAPGPLFHGAGLGLKSSVVVLLHGSTPLLQRRAKMNSNWRVAEITSALDAGRCSR